MTLLARATAAPAAATLAACWVADFPDGVSAQGQAAGAGQPQLVAVMIWTFVAIGAAMLILSLGYLYRRARGAEDEIIPQNVDPYYQQEGEAEKHGTGEAHPELPPVH
jgi:hypothetical protein